MSWSLHSTDFAVPIVSSFENMSPGLGNDKRRISDLSRAESCHFKEFGAVTW